jgi:hypothetical protein
MARLRVYPHRRAEVGSVSWKGWWLERDGTRTALPPLLGGWDYASSETIGISVAMDSDAVLQTSGLKTIDDLEVLLVADCPAAHQRFVAGRALSGYESGTTLEVDLHIPPGSAADHLRLSAHLVLARTTPERDTRVAFLRGARIHSSDPHVLRLEGDSSRFPTEALPFSELRLGRAPWTVLARYDDLAESFMGHVRLLINTEHPVGELALGPGVAPQVANLLRVDVIRLLIAQVAGQMESTDIPFEDGSVGQVLETMCRVFLGQGLRASVRLYRDNPAAFELRLHDRLDPLAGMSA